MLPIVFELPIHHGLCAVNASIERMRGGDAHIESRKAVAEGLCQNVCWAQVRSWNEASHLGLSTWVTLLNPCEKLLNHTVVAAGAFGDGTASRMRS